MTQEVNIDNAGSIGIVQDLNPHTLPPEAWTNGQNVRFLDGKVHKFLGHSEVYATPNIAPYWLLPVAFPSNYFWLVAGLAKISVFNGSAYTDITRTVGGDYSADADFSWNGGLLGGIAVLNNGIDVPQYWATPSTATKMADLSNWPAGYVCKYLVPFKSHLVALNITQSGTEYPHKVLWSHSADPGTIPTSWDVTDQTKDAGEFELSDSNSGGLVAGVPMGDQLMLYKENAVWAMQLSGNSFIFNNRGVFENVGSMATRCAVNIPHERRHLLCIGDDIVTHNGQEMKSVLTTRVRRQLLNSIDATNFQRSFMVVNSLNQEIWFCYPSTGSSFPDTVLAYNYETGILSYRDLPGIAHIETGFIDDSGGVSVTWDSAVGTWDANNAPWDTAVFNSSARRMLMADPTNIKLYYADNTNQFDGVNFNSYIERSGLAIIGRDRQGNPKVDLQSRKILNRIWPKMTGGPVTIKGLAQESKNGTITYSSPMTFDPSTDRYVDLPEPLSGLLLGIRVESSGDVDWTLDGYDLEMEVLGSF